MNGETWKDLANGSPRPSTSAASSTYQWRSCHGVLPTSSTTASGSTMGTPPDVIAIARHGSDVKHASVTQVRQTARSLTKISGCPFASALSAMYSACVRVGMPAASSRPRVRPSRRPAAAIVR